MHGVGVVVVVVKAIEDSAIRADHDEPDDAKSASARNLTKKSSVFDA
jgi:hypothetical protein